MVYPLILKGVLQRGAAFAPRVCRQWSVGSRAVGDESRRGRMPLLRPT